MIRQVARERLDASQIDIIALKYEKPKVYINGEEFSASFSHTVQGVALAISGQRIVGCDLELENRKERHLLTSRMRNSEGETSLYEIRRAIQICTIKVAALEMVA